MIMDFVSFGRIPRLTRDCMITEKIDGTNGQIYIEKLLPDTVVPKIVDYIVTEHEGDKYLLLVGSRNRWLSDHQDNFGFWHWVSANKNELVRLGEGRHFGEWWGKGIQRGYGLDHRRFSLFNLKKWGDPEVRPQCCEVVPLLHKGVFGTDVADYVLRELAKNGSKAVPGFAKPEGIVVYHKAAGVLFKKTIENDNIPKGQIQ